MSSRDLWSRGGREPLRDLLGGAFASLLLLPADDRPAYFSSPWMSDFPVFDNAYRQFTPLLPEQADEAQVMFSGFLSALSARRPVRLITVSEHKVSRRFAALPRLRHGKRLAVRFAPPEYHEKGMLAPTFYIEGSMNITYSGVNVRDEKVVLHVPDDAAGRAKLALAYMEFDRLWGGLS